MQKEQLVQALQSKEQPLENNHGKITKKSATSIDSKLVEIFGSATVDQNEVKKQIFEMMQTYSKKSDVAALEYMWLRMDDISESIAKELTTRKYSMSINVNKGKDSIGGMIKLLERDDTKIPAAKRNICVSGYELLRDIMKCFDQYQGQKAGRESFKFELDINGFKALQETLQVDYCGGISAAKRISGFREMLVETAIEIDMGGKLIQFIEMSREDVDQAMRKVVAVKLSNETLESGDKLYAAGQFEDAATCYGTALDALMPYEDLDKSIVQAKLADVANKLKPEEKA